MLPTLQEHAQRSQNPHRQHHSNLRRRFAFHVPPVSLAERLGSPAARSAARCMPLFGAGVTPRQRSRCIGVRLGEVHPAARAAQTAILHSADAQPSAQPVLG